MVFLGDDLECPPLVLAELLGGRPLGLIDRKGGDLRKEFAGVSTSASKLGLTMRLDLNEPRFHGAIFRANLDEEVREVPVHLTI